LFPYQPLETNIGFYYERYSFLPQIGGKFLKRIPGKDYPIMWHRHLFPIYGIRMEIGIRFGFVMNYKLVPKKIEIYPVRITPALLTTENLAVENTAFFQVMHRNCYMERRGGMHNYSI
jgi:hypothetical protein